MICSSQIYYSSIGGRRIITMHIFCLMIFLLNMKFNCCNCGRQRNHYFLYLLIHYKGIKKLIIKPLKMINSAAAKENSKNNAADIVNPNLSFGYKLGFTMSAALFFEFSFAAAEFIIFVRLITNFFIHFDIDCIETYNSSKTNLFNFFNFIFFLFQKSTWARRANSVNIHLWRN